MRDLLLALYSDTMPILLQLLSAVLGLVLLRVANVARNRWGIEIEARHREALHSALMSGVRAALGRGLTGTDAIDAAVAYAADSVPDAMAKLGPARSVLTDLASAKLREVTEKTTQMSFDLRGDRILTKPHPEPLSRR